VIIGAREKGCNKHKTWVFIRVKKIRVESVILVTLVLRILSCTIDATFIGILRHDEGMMEIDCNRKKIEDSRKDLESKNEEQNQKLQEFGETCRERKGMKCAKNEKWKKSMA
jgi:hypothetical protein